MKMFNRVIVLMVLASVFATSAATAASQLSSPSYALALERAILGNWSAPSALAPDVVCRVSIRQHPGGDVLEAKVIGACANDEKLSGSLRLAILRANPLPYFGYESSFSSDLTVDIAVGAPSGLRSTSLIR